MNAVQRRRFNGLADFLSSLPKINFDMGQFNDDDTMSHTKGSTKTVASEMKCDTACCVAGWAALRHRKLWTKMFGFCGSNMLMGYEEFATFYGISYKDAHSICLDRFGYSARQKAAQIRRIAKRYSK